jgi:hypothetical protein
VSKIEEEEGGGVGAIVGGSVFADDRRMKEGLFGREIFG